MRRKIQTPNTKFTNKFKSVKFQNSDWNFVPWSFGIYLEFGILNIIP